MLSLALATLAVAQLANYQCDPNQCRLPTCKCATLEPPVQNPPQFILVTFDDSIQSSLLPQSRALFANRRNPNGCPATATFYTQVLYSDPFLATEWVAQGNEIGDHSVTHAPPFAGSQQEVLGMKQWAQEFAGIRRVTGMRFPFRNYTRSSFEMLRGLGFEYDSSVSSTQRLWPFTLDNGLMIECDRPDNVCQQNLNANGLWEIPMIQTRGPQGLHLMDIYNDYSLTNPIPPEQVTSTLVTNFNEHYNGNRAPFGIYTHPIWLGGAVSSAIPDGSQKLAAVNSFLDQAMRNPDVWMVTGQQLIQYMRNPVPASQLGSQSYMQCTESPPSNICNGVGSQGVETCSLSSGSIRTCYGCPVDAPSLTNPVPARVAGNTRCAVPETCDVKYWDPVGCRCLCQSGNCEQFRDYTRFLPRPTNADGSPASTETGKKSGGEGKGLLVTLALALFGIAL